MFLPSLFTQSFSLDPNARLATYTTFMILESLHSVSSAPLVPVAVETCLTQNGLLNDIFFRFVLLREDKNGFNGAEHK